MEVKWLIHRFSYSENLKRIYLDDEDTDQRSVTTEELEILNSDQLRYTNSC